MGAVHRAAPAIRIATAVLALVAVVLGLWAVLGSPADAWRSLGDVVAVLMLVGLVTGWSGDIRRRLGRQ